MARRRGNVDLTVVAFDTKTWQEVHRTVLPAPRVESPQLTARGSLIYVLLPERASDPAEIQSLNPLTGDIRTLYASSRLVAYPIALSKDGTMLAFAVLYGLNWISTVPPTVALAADRFGRQNVGTVFGWIFCAHQIGAAVAAYGAGLLRVWLGDYTLSFLLAGGLALVGAGLACGIRGPARRLPRRDAVPVGKPRAVLE